MWPSATFRAGNESCCSDEALIVADRARFRGTGPRTRLAARPCKQGTLEETTTKSKHTTGFDMITLLVNQFHHSAAATYRQSPSRPQRTIHVACSTITQL